MFDCIIKALLLSMLVASISFFISHTQLLEKWRKRIRWRNKFIPELLSCCYCLGHWVALVVLLIFPVKLFGVFWPMDYILTWLVISWVAGLQSLVMAKLWD